MTTSQQQTLGATKSLFRSTSTVVSMTLSSRILGFIRDVIIAHMFGAGAGVDAFIVAFKLPNFFRRLFAEGAFTQAFVPVLSEYQENRTKDEIQQFLNHVSGNLSLVLFFLVVVIVMFAPTIIDIFAPGFSDGSSRYDMSVHMLRITFPYILPISLVAFAGSILNCHGNFSVPAFTPVFMNISMIACAYFLAPQLVTPIYALAWGVFAAGIVQVLFQIPFLLRIERLPRPSVSWKDSGVRRMLKLLVPAVFGVSIAQINLLVDTIFASFLQEGSVSWLYFSDRLMLFPLGVFGVAIATVILPNLSRKHASKSPEEYSQALDWGMRSVVLIGIPSALGMFLLAGPMISTLFQYGKFTPHDVYMAEQSLKAFAFGVPAFMLIKVLVSAFYAQQNIKTPVNIGVFALILNMILNFILIQHFQHMGLALATSLAGYFNASILLFFLLKRKIFTPRTGWKKFYGQLFAASSAMSALLIAATPNLDLWISWHGMNRLSHLLALIVAAILIYFCTLRLFKLKFRDFIGPVGAK